VIILCSDSLFRRSELKAAGFPPRLLVGDQDIIPTKLGSKSETFVRIGGIDLSGNITLSIRSRPVNQKLVPDFAFDLDMFDELDEKIQEASKKAKTETGRLGCTTEDLYDIIQSYFEARLKRLIQTAAVEIARGSLDPRSEVQSVQRVHKVMSGMKDAAINYAKSVGETVEDHLIHDVSRKLTELGLSQSEAQTLINATRNAASQRKNTNASEKIPP